MRGTRILALMTALALCACQQVILTAPPGSTIFLTANPPSIPAYGGVSVISGLISEAAGTPVSDGTVVQFFTTLGRIDEQGKTSDGVVRVNLVSDGRSGEATVTAFSGGGSAAPAPTASSSPGNAGGSASSSTTGQVTVKIGSSLPAHMVLVAVPNRLTDQRWSRITANVFDGSGNPLARVPVIFTIGGSTPTPTPTPTTVRAGIGTALTQAEDWLDSDSAPVFTDNNGQAFDVLRTNYPRDAEQRTVVVEATTSNEKTKQVTVTIN
jgi:hypothetical protein